MEALNTWLTTYGSFLQLLGLIMQLVYWLALSVASVWAVLLFKRLVDFKTGGGAVAADGNAGTDRPVSPPDRDKDVSVDSFVD